MDSEKRPHIGIVTGDSVPQLTKDGQMIAETLRERGFTVEPVVWSESAVEWSTFDVLLVRSCWEYYQEADAFREWVDTVEQQVDVVINDPEFIRWNVHKSYLADLEAAGVQVTPTEYVDRGAEIDLATILERRGWENAVVKPAIGTSSSGVWRVPTPVSTIARQRFDSALAENDLLVQRFLPEIRAGELSVVFLGGEYSHTRRTIPSNGEFRAHPSHGSSSELVTPSESVLEQTETVVQTARNYVSVDEPGCVYARVDGVERDGSFVLLELELIEPYLGLSAVDGGVDRFVEAVEGALAEWGQVTVEP